MTSQFVGSLYVHELWHQFCSWTAYRRGSREKDRLAITLNGIIRKIAQGDSMWWGERRYQVERKAVRSQRRKDRGNDGCQRYGENPGEMSQYSFHQQ